MYLRTYSRDHDEKSIFYIVKKLGQKRINCEAKNTIFLAGHNGNPERAEWGCLARSGSQSQCRI